MENKLSVKDCISFGWKTFTARPWIFIGTSIVLFVVSIVANIPQSVTEEMKGPGGIVLGILGFLLSTGLSFLISMGKTSFYLKAHDDVTAAKINHLWQPHPYWRFIGASILAGLATIIGLLLFIVPGIIVGIMVSFSLYIVMETGMGPWSALKESARRTKGNRWSLFLLGLALLGVNILGACALLIGLFVTVPVSTLAVVHAYRMLSKPTAPVVMNSIS